MMKSKKGFIALSTVMVVVFIAALIFGGTGIVKFIFFTDKMPYILGALFVFIIVLSRRK